MTKYQVEQRKKKQKKPAIKKDDKSESTTEASKKEDTPESAPEEKQDPEETNEAESKEADDEDGNDANDTEEPIAELKSATHQRQPSISVQSKLRSSSFRQSSGGPLSPSFGFSPDGDTAPDIHRKQAIRIEELEKENKRLAKEALDGEKRWKKAEEELEDLREADDDLSMKKEIKSSPDSGDMDRLVCVGNLSSDHSFTDLRYLENGDSCPTETKHPTPSPNLSRVTSWVFSFGVCYCPGRLRSRTCIQVVDY